MVREPEKVMEGLIGIDFLIVDSRQGDFARVMRLASLNSKGAALVHKNASSKFGSRSSSSSGSGSGSGSGFKWRSVLDEGLRRHVVRSVFLPVGKGLDIAHVSAVGDDSVLGVKGGYGGGKRWIKHIDRRSGGMCVIRY